MANPTTNYSFAMPTNTDLVKDLPADFEVFGQAVDTQMKTNADAAIAKSLVTTKGDLIAATGASTPARLGVGSNDQVLVADSTTATGLKWGTAAAGSMTVIASGSLSGNTVTLSSIAQTYKDLRLVLKNVTISTPDEVFLRLNGNSSTHYSYAQIVNNFSSVSGAQNSTYWLISDGFLSTSTPNETIFNLYDYTNSATWKTAQLNNSNGQDINKFMSLQYKSTTAITSISVIGFSTYTLGGTYILYGVN